ncbi:unnamed protein product, partial [Hapterophycus canaliculatus]
QVVVLVTEGSEESKLRNSNSKSKSITRALQTRRDKFEMYRGDDSMVPPGPRPRMVKQEMVIKEYHLSQVRRGGRSSWTATTGGVSAEDAWRLTVAQKATLAEAYSDDP